ncbi:protein GVQW3-like [Mercenaria mercenaria]|uniref:protein GVQW3-like n=1 Tax=Mercenaria mercenaria TaxID=6596 RepID=UPI00234EBED4|nr:protein GVQW3-like [Mercenaria mercenaria]
MEEIPDGETSTPLELTEQRVVITFCVKAGMTSTDTCKFMNTGECVQKVSRSLVFDWHKRFKEGREDIKDNARIGRPKLAGGVNRVGCLVSLDRRMSADDIVVIVGLSHGTVHKILTHDLEMNKVVRRDLTHAVREKRPHCEREHVISPG